MTPLQKAASDAITRIPRLTEVHSVRVAPASILKSSNGRTYLVDPETVNVKSEFLDFQCYLDPATDPFAKSCHAGYGQRFDHEAPELKLTMMAFRAAVLEKVATNLGVTAFIWATVVLLGGYIDLLKRNDFWIVSIIIFTEGARVFSRSHELDWQRHAASFEENTSRELPNSSECHLVDGPECVQECTVKRYWDKACSSGSEGKKFGIWRSWTVTMDPLVPHLKSFVLMRISSIFYFLQLISAAVSVSLSIKQISSQNFIRTNLSVDEKKNFRNLALALNVFYALALLQSSVFLLEMCYWEYKMRYKKLPLQVQVKYDLNKVHGSQKVLLNFLHEAYRVSVKDSIFDGLAMDLVGYSISQMHSNSGTQQLFSMRILLPLVKKKDLEAETLRQIGTTPDAINRLLEMLTWKHQRENEIRLTAAEIIERLVHYSGNRFKIVAVSGALEAISSLLTSEEEEIVESSFSKRLRLQGLLILKHLAEVHSNCARIGNIRGLIRIIVTLIEVKPQIFGFQNTIEYETFKISLLLVKILATTTGKSGNILRDQIGRTVLLLRNLRNIIGLVGLTSLQQLALDIVINLALHDKHREEIGRTGGMITYLLQLFLAGEETQRLESAGNNLMATGAKEIPQDEHNSQFRFFTIRKKAGNALDKIAVQNRKNCRRILELNHFPSIDCPTNLEILDRLHNLVAVVVEQSRDVTEEEGICDHSAVIGAYAANILRSLFAYLTSEEKDRIVDLAPKLLMATVKPFEQSTVEYQEAITGLVASIVEYLPGTTVIDPLDVPRLIYPSLSQQYEFPNRFLEMLKSLSMDGLEGPKSVIVDLSTYPGIRRHLLQLSIALMKKDASFKQALKEGPFFATESMSSLEESTSEQSSLEQLSSAGPPQVFRFLEEPASRQSLLHNVASLKYCALQRIVPERSSSAANSHASQQDLFSVEKSFSRRRSSLLDAFQRPGKSHHVSTNLATTPGPMSQLFEEQLRYMLKTISRVEDYCTLSGKVGLTRQTTTMEDLINNVKAELSC